MRDSCVLLIFSTSRQVIKGFYVVRVHRGQMGSNECDFLRISPDELDHICLIAHSTRRQL